MEPKSKPLATAFGWQSGPDSFTFLAPHAYVDVAYSPALLGSVLRLCNGRATMDSIADQVGASYLEVAELLQVLAEHDVIVDAAFAYEHFDRLSSNPQPFWQPLTEDELLQLEAECDARRRWNDGDAFLLPSDPSLIRRRPTCRSFEPEPVAPATLGALLHSMYGHDDTVAVVPSGGGLYPITIEVMIRKTSGLLQEGLYNYYPGNDCLVRSNHLTPTESLARALDSASIAETAPVILFLTADIRLPARKYGCRAYRFALIEAGHIAQNAQLFCAAAGLGVFEYGGYSDRLVLSALGHPASTRSVLIVLGVGWPTAGSSLAPARAEEVLCERLRTSLVGPGKVLAWTTLSTGVLAEESPFYIGRAFYANPQPRIDYVGRTAIGVAYTSRQAELAAIVEGVERYASGKQRVDLLASEVELSAPCLSPRVLSPMSRSALDLTGLSDYASDVTWQWVRGAFEKGGDTCYVPIDHVFYPLDLASYGRSPCWHANSSGVAAHANSLTARQSALLELIERDAIMVTWYARLTPPRIEPSRLRPFVQSRIEYWRERGHTLEFLDLSLDSVPTVLAVLRSWGDGPKFSAGAAAAFTYHQAVDKAMREAESLMVFWKVSEESPIEEPGDVRSPEDHGRYYLVQSHVDELSWLFGGEPAVSQPDREQLTFEMLVARFNPVMVPLNIEDAPELAIVRALSPALLPISFGFGADLSLHPRLQQLGLRWKWGDTAPPHFFA